MKNEKGVTLVALVIYILVATAVISIVAFMSSNFFRNVKIIENQDKYAVEFNKFNMFFINDVKSNKEATVETTKITFPSGVVYELKGTNIYRDGVVIASQIQSAEFTADTYEVPNTNVNGTGKKAVKNLIRVHLTIGREFSEGTIAEETDRKAYERLNKTIEYVLKYW